VGRRETRSAGPVSVCERAGREMVGWSVLGPTERKLGVEWESERRRRSLARASDSDLGRWAGLLVSRDSERERAASASASDFRSVGEGTVEMGDLENGGNLKN
jgi:hypothetical protein